MNIKKVALFLFFPCFLQAQPTLPKVTPSSPEASSLTRIFEYPVSNCTGIPDINIPLYEIKSGQLNLPISISYHSSGRRVYDKTGAIGLGWILNAGGMVSRTIYGDPDDQDQLIKFPNPWKKADELSNMNNFRFLAGIDNRMFDNIPRYDTEYDIFTYNINALSGNIILKDVNNNKVPVLIPKKPYKVEMHQNKLVVPFAYNYIDYIEIIDDSGNKYRFGKTIIEGTEYHETSSQGINGWMLTEIISANMNDIIHFKYESFRCLIKSISTIYNKKTGWTGDYITYPSPTPNPTNYESTSEESYTSQRLTEISFKQGSIIFNHELQSGYPANNENLLIKNIEIKNQNGITIRKVELSQSNLDNLSDGIMPTYKLDNIQIKDVNLSTIEKYSFDYYTTIYPVSYTNVNVRFSDFWGYYNASGKTDMCPFVPTALDNVTIVNPYADRNANVDAMKSGVLQKITYPTGGSTEFIYQANRYYDMGTIKSGDGLRIYQIKSTDVNNNVLLKTYKYGISDDWGYMPLIPSLSTMSFLTQHWNVNPVVTSSVENSYTETLYYSNVLPIFSYVAEKPIIYTDVTEYFGDEINNTGKIVYTYDRDNMTPPTLQAYGSGCVDYRFWMKSDLLTKAIYAKTNDLLIPYSLVKTITNNYTVTKYPLETIYGLRIRRNFIILPENSLAAGRNPCYTEEYFATTGIYYLPIYGYGDYTFSVGKKELTNTTEIENTNNGSFTTSTTNVFDSNHLLKEQDFIDSKGVNIKKQYVHPIDLTGNPYDEMIVKNIINSVIEFNEYYNSLLSQSTKTDYSNWGNNIIAPITVQTKQGTNAYETRLRYHSYDSRGNVTSVSKENDIKTTYIWVYNQTHPVVKADNIDYTTLNSAVTAIQSDLQTFLTNTIGDLTTDAQKSAWKLFNTTLRNNASLSNVLINTYTYKPLIGLTSQTDPNGKTTYYEYDTFGRLKLIRDDQNNILKKIDYHYSTQN